MDTKSLRAALAPYRKRSFAIPFAYLALDIALWLASLMLALCGGTIVLQALGSILLAIAMSRLFIIGHDACHQSLTPSKRLNRIVGRLCFLPTLTPYSAWEVGHNVAHHGYTNLRDRDYVWAPLSPAEYAALSLAGRALTRIYRRGAGFALYYLIEMWWKRLWFPSRAYVPVRRRIFILDSVLVGAFCLAELLLIAATARETGFDWRGAFFFGSALPFVLWNGCIGFVTYCHHTHPTIPWYADKAVWRDSGAPATATAHASCALPLAGLFHFIFEHPAHHLDMSIPFYRLPRAQAALAIAAPALVRKVSLTWRGYWRDARQCGLYDFEQGCWRPFP